MITWLLGAVLLLLPASVAAHGKNGAAGALGLGESNAGVRVTMHAGSTTGSPA